MEYIHYIDSPLGRIMISGEDGALTGLWFEGQKYFAETLSKSAEEKYLPVFAETERWLEIYFEGKDPIKELGKTSAEVADYLLDHAYVATVPGTAFGEGGEGYIRLSYATAYDQIVEAMSRMRKAFAELKA